MLFGSPFYSSPYYKNNKYNYGYNHFDINKKINNNVCNNYTKCKTKKTISIEQNSNNQKSTCEKNEKPLFEIMGIKLYFDDLLILGLLFFLYTEDVKDQNLFIALILLLLS